MLRVDNTKPYRIVYSLCRHEYLGYLIEPHVVQLNSDGGYSLTHQRIFSTTAKEFQDALDETDLRLIKLLDETEQGYLIKKFYKRAVRPIEFFSGIYDAKMHGLVRPMIERRISEALSLLRAKPLFIMSKEGWPVERPLIIADEAATVLFHFRRNEAETRYYPTIKFKQQRIEFMFRGAQIISNEPAWMLLEDTLYYFEGDIEGKKLQPFLAKRYISIPRSAELNYFQRFVVPLIEKHHVYAEGFEIRSFRAEASPVLQMIYVAGGVSQLQLLFKYGNYTFPAGSDFTTSVQLEHQPEHDRYIFHRIKRDKKYEAARLSALLQLGLVQIPGVFTLLEVANAAADGNDLNVIAWLNTRYHDLQELGFSIEQVESEKRFMLGNSSVNLEISENNDWFDLTATVTFGDYKFPFQNLKEHILRNIREFELPSGEIAVIPEEWFARYANLFFFADKHHDSLRLNRHHVGLVKELQESDLASISFSRKLQKLTDFSEISDIDPPVNFKGVLRPYQKAGYNWFHFLRNYHFGGCLADDMGLGKTIQTLALLQKVKEDAEQSNQYCTSLIVMPTSLIYNWISEAARFAPALRVLVYAGTNRNKDITQFSLYDVVLSTYGIVRLDAELLEHMAFEYVILDESQNIKNPASKAYKAVKKLKPRFRLILSGTPVENSVSDLWTQMSFVNPGLLGNQRFFQETFVSPIEKKKDEEKARKLQAIIKPFVLRRTKKQVATELPDKSEQIFYCSMTEEQSEWYEKVKSEYRNELMFAAEQVAPRTQIQLLQGLTKLRQIANHPALLDASYSGDSGKFDSVMENLLNVLAEGHKVLVFSQFVRQLDLYRQHLDKEGIRYVYLDGATRNRGEVVEEFQKNADIKLFLISLKAGGVGLNLTQADYVFMLDPWWNPAVEQQAVDRTHRIGQTRNVFIYKFITKDSVEEKILLLQNRKRSVAQSLITTEESFVKSLSADDIREILT